MHSDRPASEVMATHAAAAVASKEAEATAPGGSALRKDTAAPTYHGQGVGACTL